MPGLSCPNAIYRKNHPPVDKYCGKQLHYPLDRDLSGGLRYPPFEQLAPALRMLFLKCHVSLCKYAGSWCLLPLIQTHLSHLNHDLGQAFFCKKRKISTESLSPCLWISSANRSASERISQVPSFFPLFLEQKKTHFLLWNSGSLDLLCWGYPL